MRFQRLSDSLIVFFNKCLLGASICWDTEHSCELNSDGLVSGEDVIHITAGVKVKWIGLDATEC